MPTGPRSDDPLVRVIAVDGPAGSGKTSVARSLAARLGWRFVDTGATYRAVTLAALRAGVDPADSEAVVAVARTCSIELAVDGSAPSVLLDGADVSAEIRGPAVTAAVSAVSSIPEVRAEMIALQRRAIGPGNAVVEGRDIATVVAPQATLKVYLDARPDVRARRRAAQDTNATPDKPPSTAPDTAPDTDGDTTPNPAPGANAGSPIGLERRVLADLERRDAADSQTNPLVAAQGAVHLDTSELGLDQVADVLEELAVEAGLVSPIRTPRPSFGASAGSAARRSSGDHE